MAERVLMIEDDQGLSAMVAEYLAPLGIRITACATAGEGLGLIQKDSFDALIIDVMLPDIDGFEVCRRVRAEHDIPILMLTARGDEMDRIVGLELGADDYLPKPFNPRELLARLRAILPRLRHWTVVVVAAAACTPPAGCTEAHRPPADSPAG